MRELVNHKLSRQNFARLNSFKENAICAKTVRCARLEPDEDRVQQKEKSPQNSKR